jgi:hypothetical protein
MSSADAADTEVGPNWAWFSTLDLFDYYEHAGDLAFEDRIRAAHTEYVTHHAENPDELRRFYAGSMVTILRRIDNPFPGTSMMQAENLLLLPENHDRLVAAFHEALATEADWIRTDEDEEDPRANIRLCGLVGGLTHEEMTPRSPSRP